MAEAVEPSSDPSRRDDSSKAQVSDFEAEGDRAAFLYALKSIEDIKFFNRIFSYEVWILPICSVTILIMKVYAGRYLLDIDYILLAACVFLAVLAQVQKDQVGRLLVALSKAIRKKEVNEIELITKEVKLNIRSLE